jgi:hypothetical protein
MKHCRSLTLLAFAGSLTVALPAAAHDKNSLYARDMVHCMQGRMKANQSETYREAFKVCKQQLNPSSRAGDAATVMNTANASDHPKR